MGSSVQMTLRAAQPIQRLLRPRELLWFLPMWPSLFEEEKARLLAVVSDHIEDIQHIGSTEVPGLGAKPIIDIQMSLRDLALVEKCVGPLESIGYEYLGEYGIPGRYFFHKPAQGYDFHRKPFLQLCYPLRIIEEYRDCG